MHRLLLAFAVLTVALSLPRAVDACSCSSPEYDEFVTDGGKIPAEQGGLLWIRGQFGFDGMAPEVTAAIERQEGGEWVPVESTLSDGPMRWIEFDSSPGEYRVLTAEADGEPVERLLFETEAIGEVVDGPTLTLGAKSTTTRTFSADGSCEAAADVIEATLHVTLGEALEPYRDVLEMTLWVDGAPVSMQRSSCAFPEQGRWNRPAIEDFLAAVCRVDGEEPPGFPVYEGDHDVSVVVELRGTELHWETPVVNIDLDCGNDEPDSSPEPDGVVDDELRGCPGEPGCKGHPTDDGSGGCSTTPTAPSPAWLLALAGLFALTRRR